MRRRRSIGRVTLIAVLVIAGVIALFAYSGIEAANAMSVSIHESTIILKDEKSTTYDTTIQFRNTSFMPLGIGDTKYSIAINGEHFGKGTIKPFIIGPYSTVLVSSVFTADNAVLAKYDDETLYEKTHLTGKSNYNFYLTTFNVPIDHYPSAEQIQKFVK